MIQEIWRGSDLERLVALVNAGLAEHGIKKVVCGIGPAADAAAFAPPAITWVDGDDNEESYDEPDDQPEEGHAIWDALQRIQVVIRGANVREADALRETLFGILYDAYSNKATRPLRARRRGGGQNEEGFTIEAIVQVRWQLLRERWIQDVELTGVDATGLLTGHAGSDPETITTQETP